jgi:hypothetical protein
MPLYHVHSSASMLSISARGRICAMLAHLSDLLLLLLLLLQV